MSDLHHRGNRHRQGPAQPSWALVTLVLIVGCSTTSPAKPILTWDFADGTQGWIGNPYVKDLAVTPQGLTFTSTGIDPWIEGPAIDLRGHAVTRVTIRMKSNASAAAELFYGATFQAGRSVRFTVQSDGQWHDYALVIREPLGPQTRFRLDPATEEGQITVRSIRIEGLAEIQPPPWEQPERPIRGSADPALVKSGDLVLEHGRTRWGQLVVKVAGREMAAGYGSELIGLMAGETPQWLNLRQGQFQWQTGRDGWSIATTTLADEQGARWHILRRFKAGPVDGAVTVETEIAVSQDRQVVHLPWLTLFPGLGTFGAQKSQGLLAGLEYLSDEPSSSEADITGPDHVRRVPDAVKITFPLMAIAQGGCYIGLLWEPSEHVAALFDSPDTVFGSRAHAMGLSGPAVGPQRFENGLVAHTPFTLAANRPIKVRATIIGGRGETIIPAVRQFVALRRWPEVPQFEGGFDAAVTRLARGWLDSAANEGGLFRHAVWGDSFSAQVAADAPMYMDWLADHAADTDLAQRLRAGRDQALDRIPGAQPFNSSVSHVRAPTPPLVFGRIEAYVRQRQNEAENLLAGFDAKGIKAYRAGRTDYGKTHFANHANGLAAADVARILEGAALSADPPLIAAALQLLDRQTALYAGTVPRGAQTWEVPLHTPDILASAYLVKAYTLGHILSDNDAYLEQARYWAWTGVPFLYLENPTSGAVGPYATVAVLGATNWQAPVWFGQPVQWCGLVYGSALHLLSQYDNQGPWEQIANGITAAGLQMTWPATDTKRQGLLPDYFLLRAQISDGPAINPGTVQAHLPELYGKGRLYDLRKVPSTGWIVHAPGAIRQLQTTPASLTFTVDGWGSRERSILISGVEARPAAVTIRRAIGETYDASAPAQTRFDDGQKLMVISASGKVRIRVTY